MRPVARRGARATAWAGPISAGTFLAGVLTAVRTANSPYPRPGSTTEQIQDYFQGSARAARISVAGQLVSAAALLPYGSAVADLASAVPGGRPLANAARLGSATAAAALAVSALTSAALTGSAGRRPARVALLHQRSFLAGGPIHTAGFGLLTGALSIAGWRSHQLPRPLAAVAGASAVVALLSPSYLVTERAVLFIPAGRFSGLLVAGIAGAVLGTKSRR